MSVRRPIGLLLSQKSLKMETMMTINHDDAERSRFVLNTCTPLALLTLEFANRSSVEFSSCDVILASQTRSSATTAHLQEHVVQQIRNESK